MKHKISDASPIFTATPTGEHRFPKNDEYYRYSQSPKSLWHYLAADDESTSPIDFSPNTEHEFEIYTVKVSFPKGPRKTNGS